MGIGDVDDDDPLVNVHLGRRQADAFGLVHRLGHVVDQAANALVDLRDRAGDGLQPWVGVAKDVETGHM